ncbi:MAG: hypothetical protein KGH64_02830, partial [Candidatus Micrarchaeota archaeon]|nr:hypothetical protein [Candidatus Micrarchaeota archaeon]
KNISVVNVSQGQNCTYGSVNGTCITPKLTIPQAKTAAERILAAYGTLNSTLSLLPYFSKVNNINASYLPVTKQWYVSIPYKTPYTSNTYLFGVLISDANPSSFATFVQELPPGNLTNNYVVAPGVIKLYSQTQCSTTSPLQVYWFIDPYAPGSIPSLVNESNLQSSLGSKANFSVKILYTSYSQKITNTYGLNNTVALGDYIECGSLQRNFTGFVKALNASYSGTYMPSYILSGIAGNSGFNMSSLNSCISAASSPVVRLAQHDQAQRFNVTSPSAVVTDCQYLSIPQTAHQAICYSNSTLCMT